MSDPLSSIEADLHEVFALADILQALGASERNIARDTIHVIGMLLEDAANRIETTWEAARKAAEPEAGRASS